MLLRFESAKQYFNISIGHDTPYYQQSNLNDRQTLRENDKIVFFRIFPVQRKINSAFQIPVIQILQRE